MKDKLALWKDFSALKATTRDQACCLIGDLIAVRNPSERRGIRECGSQKCEILGFNDFIERNFLVKLPVVGKKFTWYKTNESAKRRIDRVLVSDE